MQRLQRIGMLNRLVAELQAKAADREHAERLRAEIKGLRAELDLPNADGSEPVDGHARQTPNEQS